MWRERCPLSVVAVSVVAADVYVACGYAYGPIFVSVVVALFSAVQAGHRRSTWLLAAAGFVGFVAAVWVDPRSGGLPGVPVALVVGWLAVVLAISELVRVRRAQSAERRLAEYESASGSSVNNGWGLPRNCTTCLPTTSRSSTCRPAWRCTLSTSNPTRLGPP